MAKKLKITRAKAIEIFSFCQWKSAEKWDNARMAQKLSDVKDVLPDTARPESIKDDLVNVIANIDDGGEFEVVGDAAVAAPAADTAASTTDAASEPAAAGEATETTAPTAAKVPKEKKEKAPKPPKAEKAPKPPKEPKPAKEKKKGRPYCAGVVLKSLPLGAEITDEMIKQVDDLCGTPNPKESKAWLLIASSIVAGYVNGMVAEKTEAAAS